MEAAGGAPRVRSEQVEAAIVLPSFASLDIREKERKRAAEVFRIKLMAEAKLLMVKGEKCSADIDWHKARRLGRRRGGRRRPWSCLVRRLGC